MALNLDLGPSEAKFARAREHLDTLEQELPSDVAEKGPYAARFTEVDPQTGWCEVWLVPDNIEKPDLSVIFGDFIHNLRCALDYIVTALADASETPVTTRHQFPIFRTEAGYLSRVGPPTNLAKDGPLGRIKYGQILISELQPWKRQPYPRHDPLWHIYRFSNADKHRAPATFLGIPTGALKLRYNGTVVEHDDMIAIENWTPNEEFMVGRLRFDPPVARNLRVEPPIMLSVEFVTPPFETEPQHGIMLATLRPTCDHVGMVIEMFKQL